MRKYIYNICKLICFDRGKNLQSDTSSFQVYESYVYHSPSVCISFTSSCNFQALFAADQHTAHSVILFNTKSLGLNKNYTL